MLSLPSIFNILSKIDTYPAEDFVDRLNFRATVYILAFFVLLTGSKQHFGKPIQCMAPPESPESWVDYYHDYCYIQDKLRIYDMDIRKSIEYETRERVGADYTPIGRFLKEDSSKYWSPRVMYYQWVPYVLFLQAIFFLIPKLFWKLVGSHWCNGVDLETAIVEAEKIRTLVGEDRISALTNLAGFINDVLDSKNRSFFGSSIVSVCYVLTKWFEVVNGFGQFYMLSCFIGQGDHFWGLHLMITVLNGSDDPNNGIFPRIVLCDVTRFALANLHQEHMQCVLMLNFINEKIYTFLWFWIVFICIASTWSALKQTIALFFPMYRGLIADNFLPNQNVLFSSAAALYGIRPSTVNSQALVNFFVHEVLRCDGVLLLSFINGNVGGLVTHDIAHHLWKITVQPAIFGFEKDSTLNKCFVKEKNSSALFWTEFPKLPNTMPEIGVSSSCLEAGGEPQSFSLNNNKQHATPVPLPRIRSLSVGNVETQLPTAPLESSPLISVSSAQEFEDSTHQIQSLFESSVMNHKR